MASPKTTRNTSLTAARSAPPKETMKINIVWDYSTVGVPQSFVSAVQQAAQLLSSAITNNITVNIQVGLDSIYGKSMGSAFALGTANFLYANYTKIVTDLTQSAQLNRQPILTSALPPTNPLSGNFVISTAEAKAFGLLSANAAAIDGATGFSSAILTTSYSQMVDTALHELTHALGRSNSPVIAGTADYCPLSLYTYVAPGVLWNPANIFTPGYFSVDGGIINQGTFSTFDVADFASTTDPFSYVANQTATLTSLDNMVLQSLGFVLSVPSATLTVASLLTQFALNPAMAPARIADTGANIASHWDTLQQALSGIYSIAQSDTGPLTIQASQYKQDTGVLVLLQNSITLQVTGVATADLVTILTDSRVTSCAVVDGSSYLSAYIDILQTNLARLSTITMTDNGPIGLTYRQFQGDQGALAHIQGAYSVDVYGATVNQSATLLAAPHVTMIAVSDNGANLARGLDFLQANLGQIYAITQTDSTPLSITKAQYLQDQFALSLLGVYNLTVSGVLASDVATLVTDPNILSLAVTATLADVVTQYIVLIQHISQLSSVTLTDMAPITVNVAQFIAAAPLLSKISQSPLLTVADTASQLNMLPLNQVTSQHLGLDITALNANVTLSGATVAQLDVSALPGVTVTTNTVGTNTLVTMTYQGMVHTLALQNQQPSQLAVTTANGNVTFATSSTKTTLLSTGALTVVLGVGGTDLFHNIQRFHFTDTNLAFDLAPTQAAGMAAELLGATYGSSALANPSLVGQTLAQFDAGLSIMQVAQEVLANNHYATPAALVSALWQNVVGSPIGAVNLNIFTTDLTNGTFTPATLLTAAAQTSLNQNHIGLSGLATHGLHYA